MKRAIPAGWDEARRSFWLLPAVGLTLGIALGLGVPAIDDATTVNVPVLAFRQSQAHVVLQTLATVSVSVAGIAFSVTVVAFQLASQQLSPRVLRTFQADRLSQTLLALLLGLFVYCLLVLGRMPADGLSPAPQLSLTTGIAAAVATFGLFAAFIHNVVISLQAATLIRRIAADGHRAIERAYPSHIGHSPPDLDAARHTVDARKANEESVLVRAPRAGFLQLVKEDDLLEVTAKHDALVEQRMSLGDFAVTGSVLAEVWARDQHEEVEREVSSVFELGDERTVVQDVAFPIRQLADVALRALSPSLNDPTTAENAMDSLADTLVLFARSERPPLVRCDQDGRARFIALAPTLDDLVRLGFEQVGRASIAYPVMARRLLTLLAHIAWAADEQGVHCEEAHREADLIRDHGGRGSGTDGRDLLDVDKAGAIGDDSPASPQLSTAKRSPGPDAGAAHFPVGRRAERRAPDA